ncbi:uncharacterized protein LOC34622340 [Cyclospora cayetanensis]|uniref:Uncharacterized protein n=2 Tax=Cyclospora cayetanensis TaxID=88456 RepID=A0A1D3D6H4_9EIME|nr:uncharacterized protein LOC34622340 [Cyclospora cayetanensis]OEH79051.1 hypothetical protein cyc_06098 [Cyclospora cayetanensis]
MAPKHLITVALAVALAVHADPDTPKCENGAVHFEGHATFEDNQKPMQLSKEAVLTIDVEEASSSSTKAPVYSHKVSLDNYSINSDITYNFCADLQGLESKKASLKAHIVDPAEGNKVEYIGETVVTTGSDSYEADLTLAKVEQGPAGEPSVADCNFGPMSDEVTGIAVKAFVKMTSPKPLPKPTYLAVTLQEINPETGEPEVISLFAGDISTIYEPGKPVPAFLCAKVPTAPDSAKYTLDATVHLGWDGFAKLEDEERTPRKGDLVAKKGTTLEITPEKHDYSVDISVKPYDPTA